MKMPQKPRATTHKDTELRFPLHFDSGYIGESGGWDTLHRVEADGTHYTVSKQYVYGALFDADYKCEKSKMNIGKELDSWLDSSSPATEAEFLALVIEIREELSRWLYVAERHKK